MKWIIAFFFFIVSVSCEKQQDKSSFNASEIKRVHRFLQEIKSFSRIDTVPVELGDFGNFKPEAVDVSVCENGSTRYVSGENEIIVPRIGQIVNKDKLLSYCYWKSSLYLEPLSIDELSDLNALDRSFYAEKMGLKANLMTARKKCYIIENFNNNIICMLGDHGELYGRIWSNNSLQSKDFRGHIIDGSAGAYSLLRHISVKCNFKCERPKNKKTKKIKRQAQGCEQPVSVMFSFLPAHVRYAL